MEWSEDAIAVGTRRHGESSVILEVLTRAHGRHLGLVRGGRSRRLRPTLQPGNVLRVTWRARLFEHLGNFRVEPVRDHAALLLHSAVATYGVQMLGAHARLLPERDPHPRLYDAAAVIVEDLVAGRTAGELMVRFELLLLEELGFGLDLARCAATGTTVDLAYVSPKTGRAVSREAGRPYDNRMLALPSFLVDRRPGEPPDRIALRGAFDLTGHFLDRHVYGARGLHASEARAGYLAALLGP